MEHLIELVKFRLSSVGKSKSADGTPVETNIFSDDQIEKALELSLAAFNSYKNKTCNFEEVIEYNYTDMITLHACVTLLEAQALIEKGREYIVIDNGISFHPAIMSDFLMNLAMRLWERWLDMIQRI